MRLVNSYIGSPVLRVEDLRLLRGKGTFVDDIPVERLLHAAIVRSSIAHGRINNIDTRQARGLPGVHAILTAKDVGEVIPRIPVRLNSAPELDPYHQPVIANGKVRYVGEPLAVIVADSAAIAEDAIEHVAVDLGPLQPALGVGPSKAAKTSRQDATDALFQGNPGNRALTSFVTKGDAERAFAQAEYVRRESFYVHRHTGIMMEARGVLAEWDSGNQRLTVSGASKVPFVNRKILAGLMNIAETSVDMIEGDSGGSFGLRGEFFPEDYLIPFAARLLGRPVKWIEDRREHFISISHAREVRCEIEIACNRDGTILGLRGDVHADVGAYVRTAGTVGARNVALFMAGAYHVPHIDIRSHVELSSKAPVGTYRAPGRYEADFCRERMLDLVSDDLGIDRLELRRKNLVQELQMPYPIPPIMPAPSHAELDSGAYEQVLNICLEKFDWKTKQALQGRQIDGRYHGIAVGCFVEGGAAGPSENAKIELRPDGTFAIYVGSSAVGQGVETVLSQIAADALGVDIGRIKLFHGSTTYVKEGWGSYASRSTVMGGSAILLCANDFKTLLKESGAAALGVSPGDVSLVEDAVRASDGREVRWTSLDASRLTLERTFFNKKHTFCYGSHAAHVSVDPRNGHVQVLDYVAVEDPGVVVNPLTLHGQVVGAIVQGLGGTLLEQLIYDSSGQLLTASFADYLMPLATDFPTIRAYSVPLRPSPNNPLGIKGAGEGGIIPVGGVIANAVANALRSMNVQPNELPLSPSRIWELIKDARSRAAVK